MSCINFLYDEPFLKNRYISILASSKRGIIFNRYEPKFNLPHNFACKPPIPNLIENRSVVSEIKHTGR